MKKETRFIAEGAIIAALYICLTFLSSLFGLSSGVIQLRFSEALTILPAFTPSSIWGLFTGCIVSNIITGANFFDVIFGSLATLIGALGTYYFGKKMYQAPIFPILSNTIIIPFVLRFVYGAEGALPYFFVTVFIGEFLSCGVLGVILYKALKKAGLFTKNMPDE